VVLKVCVSKVLTTWATTQLCTAGRVSNRYAELEACNIGAMLLPEDALIVRTERLPQDSALEPAASQSLLLEESESLLPAERSFFLEQHFDPAPAPH